MILSKYDSDTDVYQHYHIKQNVVTYEKRYLKGQTLIPIRKWNHTLQELGWTSAERYIKHIKSKGYKEVKGYASMATPETAVV